MTLAVNLVRTGKFIQGQNKGKLLLVAWQYSLSLRFPVPLFSHTYHPPST